jgi:putative oxidoreductase
MNTFFKKIISTNQSFGGLFARLALGIMIFPHGAQKLLGWYGGYGFSGTIEFFTEKMGIPWLFALAAIIAEFFGGVALILGLGTRVASALVGVTMSVAMVTVHLRHGFFMNWFGKQSGEGIEFFILAIGLAAALLVIGGGKWSIDSKISTNL